MEVQHNWLGRHLFRCLGTFFLEVSLLLLYAGVICNAGKLGRRGKHQQVTRPNLFWWESSSSSASECACAFNNLQPPKTVDYLIPNQILSLSNQNYSIERFLPGVVFILIERPNPVNQPCWQVIGRNTTIYLAWFSLTRQLQMRFLISLICIPRDATSSLMCKVCEPLA